MFKKVLFFILVSKVLFADIAIVKVWSVNVREKPSKTSKVIRIYQIGDIIDTKTDFDDSWIQLSNGYFI